jgi:hypothetical protein
MFLRCPRSSFITPLTEHTTGTEPKLSFPASAIGRSLSSSTQTEASRSVAMQYYVRGSYQFMMFAIRVPKFNASKYCLNLSEKSTNDRR